MVMAFLPIQLTYICISCTQVECMLNRPSQSVFSNWHTFRANVDECQCEHQQWMWLNKIRKSIRWYINWLTVWYFVFWHRARTPLTTFAGNIWVIGISWQKCHCYCYCCCYCYYCYCYSCCFCYFTLNVTVIVTVASAHCFHIRTGWMMPSIGSICSLHGWILSVPVRTDSYRDHCLHTIFIGIWSTMSMYKFCPYLIVKSTQDRKSSLASHKMSNYG